MVNQGQYLNEFACFHTSKWSNAPLVFSPWVGREGGGVFKFFRLNVQSCFYTLSLNKKADEVPDKLVLSKTFAAIFPLWVTSLSYGKLELKISSGVGMIVDTLYFAFG